MYYAEKIINGVLCWRGTPDGEWIQKTPEELTRRTIMDVQALVDGLNAKEMRERALTQLTLGALIAVLKAMPADTQVANLHDPGSYRGYYSDLYFELGDGTRPASELLSECKAAMGQMFTGYKGGDFVMGALTPLWVATYGGCGAKLMAVKADGKVETAEDD